MGLEVNYRNALYYKDLPLRDKSFSATSKHIQHNSLTNKPQEKLPSINASQAIVYFTASPITNTKNLIDQIDPGHLKKHIEKLASEEMAGRHPGSEGIVRAETYIRQELKRYGIRPFKLLANNFYEQKAVYQTVYHECKRTEGGMYIKDESEDALEFDRKQITFVNLVGIKKAKKPSDEYVFITAHYDHLGRNHDTGEIYRGADDNASGISAMLEIARIFAKTNTDKNIVFVATSGEEYGGLGASYLAKQLKAKGLKDKVQIINIDCIAAEGDYISIAGGNKDFNKHLEDKSIEQAEKLGIKYQIAYKAKPINHRTDAGFFNAMGIPAITLLWAWDKNNKNRKHYHRPSDTPDIVNYDNVIASTKLALSTVYELSKNSTTQQKEP